ncbi:MAG: hypothetical protein V1735_00180 [Nanoarchaeota archaeon]
MVHSVIQEEREAFLRITGGKHVRCLVGVGALSDVEHCFALGYPPEMHLFDLIWSDARNKEHYSTDVEIDGIRHLCDPGTAPRFVKRSRKLDVAEFMFAGRKITVFLHKTRYDPAVLKTCEPQVFHLGHAGVEIKLDELKKTLLSLPAEAYLLNVGSPASHFFLLHYFLALRGSYPERIDRFIFQKMGAIQEKELKAITAFAQKCEQYLIAQKIVQELFPTGNILVSLAARQKLAAAIREYPWPHPEGKERLIAFLQHI